MISIDFWQIAILIFCILAIVQTLFLVLVLVSKAKEKKAQLFMALVLTGLALRIGKSIFSHLWTEKIYWGVWIGCVGLWLIGPSLNGYAKKRLHLKWSLMDKLGFLPVVFLVLAYGSIDLDFINWAYRLGTAVLGAYLIRLYFYDFSGMLTRERNTLLIGLSVIEIAFIAQLLTGSVQWYAVGSLVACVSLYYLNFSILKDKLLLKRNPGPGKQADQKTLETVLARLENLLSKEKLYLSKGLTIAMVAQSLEIPAYLVTQAIHHANHDNFNQWINSYRVAAIKKILEDPRRNDKVEHLAKEFGFAGVSSLYQAFKKETGMTLMNYRKTATRI